MSTQPDNPPAFPKIETELCYEDGHHYPHVYSAGGMTLRDYFAAHAAESDIQEYGYVDPIGGNGPCGRTSSVIARYRYADAMLRARNAKTKEEKQ